jgi:hypothetical protein
MPSPYNCTLVSNCYGSQQHVARCKGKPFTSNVPLLPSCSLFVLPTTNTRGCFSQHCMQLL